VVTDWWGRGSTVYERTGVLLVANRVTHAFLRERLKDVPVKGPDEGS
jgi:myo-inositol-1(or 4)-monophosphatase